jgi:hypothetical protein
MAALGNMQEILIDAYFDDLLDDEEFVLFYDLNRTRNPPFPYWKYDPFDLNQMTEAECKAEFRVEKQDKQYVVQVRDSTSIKIVQFHHKIFLCKQK